MYLYFQMSDNVLLVQHGFGLWPQSEAAARQNRTEYRSSKYDTRGLIEACNYKYKFVDDL